MSFNEYACGKNSWLHDEDKIKNMHPFLASITKKCFQLRITQFTGLRDSWEFLAILPRQPGPQLEPCHLFQVWGRIGHRVPLQEVEADQYCRTRPAQHSVISVVKHSLPKELQRQVQAPASTQGLLTALQHVGRRHPHTALMDGYHARLKTLSLPHASNQRHLIRRWKDVPYCPGLTCVEGFGTSPCLRTPSSMRHSRLTLIFMSIVICPLDGKIPQHGSRK